MARPRGFIENWKPTEPVNQLVMNVRDILEENRDIAPLTLRQIFYMLVTGYGFDKTEQAYKRLCETMNKARRAQRIGMSLIRDDGLRRIKPWNAWESDAAYMDRIRYLASKLRLKRQEGQAQYLFVWCEAGGMAPQLHTTCDPWGVEVLSSGGFDSVTTKHNFAREASYHGVVEVLHIGDHDPSGVHMHSSLDEDLQAFMDYYGGTLEVTRLAVTPLQVSRMGLPTAPPKRTDNRSFSGLTTQAEAIPPRRLKEIVEEAIRERFDMDEYNDVLQREREARSYLTSRLEDI